MEYIAQADAYRNLSSCSGFRIREVIAQLGKLMRGVPYRVPKIEINLYFTLCIILLSTPINRSITCTYLHRSTVCSFRFRLVSWLPGRLSCYSLPPSLTNLSPNLNSPSPASKNRTTAPTGITNLHTFRTDGLHQQLGCEQRQGEMLAFNFRIYRQARFGSNAVLCPSLVDNLRQS